MKHVENLLVAIAAVLAPVKAVMITVAILVMIDLVLAIMAAMKHKQPITSNKLKRSVGKMFMYQVAITVAFLVQTFLTKDSFPALNLISSLIGITELKSILENLDKFTGHDVLKSLINRIIQHRESEINKDKGGDK